MYILQEELRGCNSNIGYRQMWAVLKDKHSLIVKRCVVLCCMCGASISILCLIN